MRYLRNKKSGVVLTIILLLCLSGCGLKPDYISYEPDTSDPSTQKESSYPIELFFFAESNGSVYNARACT